MSNIQLKQHYDTLDHNNISVFTVYMLLLWMKTALFMNLCREEYSSLLVEAFNLLSVVLQLSNTKSCILIFLYSVYAEAEWNMAGHVGSVFTHLCPMKVHLPLFVQYQCSNILSQCRITVAIKSLCINIKTFSTNLIGQC